MSALTRGSFRRGLLVAVTVSFVLAGAASAAAQQIAYVAATLDDTCSDPLQNPGCSRGLISIVDPALNQVRASLDVWRGVVRGRLNFRTILVDPSGSRLYAVLTELASFSPPFPQSTIIRVFDTRTLRQVAELSMPALVSDCVFSADGGRLFCGGGATATDVTVIDAGTNAVAATIPAVFPTGVALSPSGSVLFISHFDRRVSVHDSTSYALLATVPLPAVAFAMAVTPDGAHLYATLSDQSVADIDTTTNTVAGVVPGVATGSNLPLDVTFAKGRAYVPTGGGTGVQETVTVIDIASRTITARIPIINPTKAAASLDQSHVFVAHESGLSTIDTATNQVIANTLVPSTGLLALGSLPPFSGVVIDTPVEGAHVQQPFLLGGWAADVGGAGGGPGIDTVHVWAFPASGASPVFIGAAAYGLPRPDVAAFLGPSYLNAGYQTIVRGLSPGQYTLTAFGHSSRTGTFSVARQLPLAVESSLRMAVDVPVAGAVTTGSIVVAGWALDGDAMSGSGIDAVHVWAYPSSGAPPIFGGAATLGYSRPDVAVAFGAQFASSGYALAVQNLAPGSYTLIVYAHQASSGTFAEERAVSVTVVAPTPHLFIDLPAANATLHGSVRVAGWALETGAATGTGVDAVHVWAYPSSGGAPILVGVAFYGAARPDVGAVFGARYTPSGFDVTGSLPPGAHDVVVFAHSTTTNSFAGVRVVHVTVQ